ncbi:tRNA pseudouridine(13) synthase TruD [Candidatus Sodalis endolongispinus]|uniref:tRNA pseudouridine synthase D n=1 Tax=Candidatus Sodalis endolongispinus TaxID=2812662 RepID=A0ABS5YDV9_9GAMM|nr:tRNA pseudouridine(13) synthase TruD [Candidatus Sodalis endolongispinus]MBT9432311.1 tRNA pseudouridine(13) synthase TruD [Candidatus Sodalis endolongispinus]
MDYHQLHWLQGKPAATGIIKAGAADFQVCEELGFEPDGEGEHELVRLRKTGCNTPYVAEALAAFAGIPARAVSYAGLKDRHAITEQWFCLHLPGKSSPDFAAFQLTGCEILATARHRRKLRIGTLKGNAFTMTLREISDRAEVEARLHRLGQQGVPNYFGHQRFGHQGNNLTLAQRWANDELRIKDRGKRSFALSAARSALFNSVVSQRLAQLVGPARVLDGDALQLTGRGSWFVASPAELPVLTDRLTAGELSLTAPLPGGGALGSHAAAAAFEYACLATQPAIGRLTPARRALLLRPEALCWHWPDDATLTLSFSLPAGSYATAVVRELLDAAADIAHYPARA